MQDAGAADFHEQVGDDAERLAPVNVERKGQFDLAKLGLKEAAAPAIWNAVLSTR